MVNAQQATAAAAGYQRAMNRSRYTPPVPEMFREASEANKLYIFNVGPWQHIRPMGSLGIKILAPCPEGKDYSDPIVVPGVIVQPYPIDPAENKLLHEDGALVAQQILGEGPHMPPNASWRPWGCFITKNAKPTKDELATARQALNRKLVELIRQAGEAYAEGPAKAREVIDPKYHHVAARLLKKTVAECPWMRDSEAPADRANCPGCGTVYQVGIMKCRECGYIIDLPAYQKAAKEGRFAPAA